MWASFCRNHRLFCHIGDLLKQPFGRLGKGLDLALIGNVYVGELTMTNDLLEHKIDRLERGLPISGRSSKP